MCENIYAEHHYCGQEFDGRRVSPFADYADFLTFIEAEFKARGEPKKRAEATEFFRSVARETTDGENETSNRRSRAKRTTAICRKRR